MAKRKERQSAYNRAVIRKLMDEGKSASAIAKETGMSYTYVKMIVGQERSE